MDFSKISKVFLVENSSIIIDNNYKTHFLKKGDFIIYNGIEYHVESSDSILKKINSPFISIMYENNQYVKVDMNFISKMFEDVTTNYLRNKKINNLV